MIRGFSTRCGGLLSVAQPFRPAVVGGGMSASTNILGSLVPSFEAPLSTEASEEYNTLRVEIDSPVGMITIARPKALNAVSMEVKY